MHVAQRKLGNEHTLDTSSSLLLVALDAVAAADETMDSERLGLGGG